MNTEIKIVQFFDFTGADTTQPFRELRFQNYFVNTEIQIREGEGNKFFKFAPFQVQGISSSIGGDNSQIRILFPATRDAIQLVGLNDGNRNSRLELVTKSVNNDNRVADLLAKEFYIGLGASFSETTVELRFNTAVDAVASNFPAQRLSEENVGILPLDASLSLR